MPREAVLWDTVEVCWDATGCDYYMELLLTLQRYLDHVEALMLNTAPTAVMKYQGHVDESALARAFELLCVKFPVLRARVKADDQGYLLHVPSNNYPAFIVLDGDQRTLEHEAAGPWDPEHALARLILVRGEDGGSVALRTDHAVVDGHHWVAIQEELWRLYSALMNGSDISIDRATSLPSSPSTLLAQRLREFQPPTSTSSAGAHRRPNLREILGKGAVAGSVRFDQKTTSSFVNAARTRKTSVHALICGAILVAQRNDCSESEPLPMVCLSPVDLRKRVTPPVGTTEVTMFTRGYRAEVTVPANGDPVSTGEEVKEQLDNATAHELLSFNLAEFLAARNETTPDQYLAVASVSNIGAMRPFYQADDLTVTDYEVLGRPSAATFPYFGAFTYAGRLTLRYVYPSKFFTNDEVEKLVKAITEQIVRLGGSSSLDGVCIESRTLS